MDRKIEVLNLTKGRVGYTIPNRHVRRLFAPHMTMTLPFEEIEEGLYNTGIRTMFAEGMLKVVNDKDAKDLGLKGGTGIVEREAVTESEVLKMLRGPIAGLEKFLSNTTPAAREMAGELAVANKIVEPRKAKLIEKYTKVNVLKALSREQDMAVADKDE